MRQYISRQGTERKVQARLVDPTYSKGHKEALFTTHTIKLPPPLTGGRSQLNHTSFHSTTVAFQGTVPI